MNVMVLVKACQSSETGRMLVRENMLKMGQFNEELINAGVLVVAEGLKPSSAGVRMRFSGESRTVSQGPFEQTSELVAGYWIWEVSSMEEAVQWLRRCPNPMPEDSDIEIRPLYTMDDVKAMMAQELQSSE